MEPIDQIVGTAQVHLSHSFGRGATALNWQAIIAAIMGLLSGCSNPSAQNVRENFKRPLVQIKLMRRLLQHGVPLFQVPRVMLAVSSTLEQSSDDDLLMFVDAAFESQ